MYMSIREGMVYISTIYATNQRNIVIKASFTRIVKVTVFMSGIFDLFRKDFDRWNRCVTHFARQSVFHHSDSVKPLC